jgi:hypothetical protein
MIRISDDDAAMDDEVERLYSALVDAVRQSRPMSFDAPVTVAEIYQDLVPYRLVRGALGFEMNADYEHALLRLLAGIGELARLEPLEAAAELLEELESPNPNVGLFRKFAGCDVWISPPEAADPHAAPVPVTEETPGMPEPGRDQPSLSAAAFGDVGRDPGTDDVPPDAWDGVHEGEHRPTLLELDEDDEPGYAQPANGSLHASRMDAPVAIPEEDDVEAEYEIVPVSRQQRQVSPAGGARGASPVPEARQSGLPRSCAFCDSELPLRAHLRFCPFCGTDQALRPCGACGEPLEPGWRFCVACGSTAAETGSTA